MFVLNKIKHSRELHYPNKQDAKIAVNYLNYVYRRELLSVTRYRLSLIVIIVAMLIAAIVSLVIKQRELAILFTILLLIASVCLTSIIRKLRFLHGFKDAYEHKENVKVIVGTLASKPRKTAMKLNGRRVKHDFISFTSNSNISYGEIYFDKAVNRRGALVKAPQIGDKAILVYVKYTYNRACHDFVGVINDILF